MPMRFSEKGGGRGGGIMTQQQRREYLIRALLAERGEAVPATLPSGERDQKRLLRALFNVRPPGPVSRDFLEVQDAYLQEVVREKGVTDVETLPELRPGISLWQGDITTVRCDAVVNAANSRMLGCFCPNHGCIDNAVHTFAGVQLRQACAEIMEAQGRPEETGGAKITPGFNLPCRWILHTVGPVIRGPLTQRDIDLLASCYVSCLELAERHGVETLAFCCISTGEFCFPPQKAAETALAAVAGHLAGKTTLRKVIFNVFKDSDAEIYRGLLG